LIGGDGVDDVEAAIGGSGCGVIAMVGGGDSALIVGVVDVG
jgi:hypothetical protein